MKKVLCWAVLLCVAFSGCASARSRKAAESDLSAKVSVLEKQLVKIEGEHEQLIDAVRTQAREQKEIKQLLGGRQVSSSPAKQTLTFNNASKKDIQTALKNAGYYDGEIDGKIGPKTSAAIMKFQEENDLKVDGVVGKETWELLSAYLK